MTSKQRYDAKRKGNQERKQRAAERAITRFLIRRGLLAKTGWCHSMECPGSINHTPTKTVFHHRRYTGRLEEQYTLELCYKCHRKEHPRPMPNGKVV